MKYKNLTLVGTSHISEQSVMEVKQAIESEKPEIVALELDKRRLAALLSKKKTSIRLSDIRRVGVKGFLFVLLASWLQKRLGKIVNVSPGTEMLTAFRIARREKIEIMLIDQDIEVTIFRLSKAITWREKWRFLVDIFRGIFFKNRELKRYGLHDLDLSKVPSKELIKKLTKTLKKRYPSIHKVLVADRNIIMARNLREILALNPDRNIVAVVGAGHESEIIRLIKTGFPEGITYEFNVG